MLYGQLVRSIDETDTQFNCGLSFIYINVIVIMSLKKIYHVCIIQWIKRNNFINGKFIANNLYASKLIQNKSIGFYYYFSKFQTKWKINFEPWIFCAFVSLLSKIFELFTLDLFVVPISEKGTYYSPAMTVIGNRFLLILNICIT